MDISERDLLNAREGSIDEILSENVPLAPLTTIGVGGNARFFRRAESVDDVIEGLEWARMNDVPVFVMSGGSNLLISDRGFPGLVIQIALKGIVILSEGAKVTVRAAAGEEWDLFVVFCVDRGYAGVECLSGIPGSIGATPIQNVGAYGQDVSETIVQVEAWDRKERKTITLSREECHFGYRQSRFKNEEPNRFVILSVDYALIPGGSPAVRYPDLEKYLAERNIASPSLRDVREATREVRRRKGMVIDPADPDTRSCGSFFMNPVLDREAHGAFVDRARSLVGPDERIPSFPAADGAVKVSAAWLIEQAGFRKGFSQGRAGISTKHTLAVVNRGGATAEEILALVRMVQDKVRERFAVEIHPEPNMIGFGGTLEP